MDEHRFRAPWNTKVWIMTVLFVAILGSVVPVTIAKWPMLRAGAQLALIGPMIIAVLFLVILILAAALAPRGYVLSAQSLRIVRLGKDIIIPASTITHIEAASGSTVFRHALRTMGSGGAFGIYGRFYSPALGDFIAYATNDDEIIVIRRGKDKPVVISPEHAQAFIDTCRELGIGVG